MSYSIDYAVCGNRASSGYSSCSSGYNTLPFSQYSVLENKVSSGSVSSSAYSSGSPEQVVVEAPRAIIYDKNEGYLHKLSDKFDAYYTAKQEFSTNLFLANNRKNVSFVKATEEVKELVRQTFELLTGKPLPDFNIKVCNAEEMMQEHPNWEPSIKGFAVPGKAAIFVLEAPLDELIVTIGHEIGHLLAKSASNVQDEEAKAFAFSVAWVRTIKENNIGNLAGNLVIPEPARNGVHDKAWEFVNQLIKAGESPLSIFYQLSSGYISNWRII